MKEIYLRMKESLHSSKFRITEVMVENAINSLNASVGVNGLHSNHFKLSGKGLVSFLSNLFSAFLTHGFVPELMLRGEIRPTVKDNLGKRDDSNNYRPVTTSSICMKILEYCILGSLQNNLKLNTRQFGFRKYTSTSIAAPMIKETVSSYIYKKSNVYSAFLDLSKAFDKVNHHILVNKLCNSRVPSIIVNIILEIYSKQQVFINFNDNKGELWLLENGVRQGGVISPILFNFYIDDVLTEISKMSVGCKLDGRRHNSQAYADDLTLLSPSISGLQILLDKIHRLLSNLDLNLNAQKSVCLVFTRKKQKLLNNIFSLNGENLRIVDSYKYLGFEFLSSLFNTQDIIRAEKSFLRQFYSIYRKFHSVDRNILRFLFESHCMSFYGSELWDNMEHCSTKFKSLSINYHKCIKKLMNKKWYSSNHVACEEANLLIFKHFVNYKLLSFCFNLIDSKSACIKPFHSYFYFKSFIVKRVQFLFRTMYDVNNIFNNDIDALRSRISFIQGREPRSNFTFD